MCPCPALYGCGALYRLFQFRSFHNLQADIRNQLHTFFLYTNPPHRRCYGIDNYNTMHLPTIYNVKSIAIVRDYVRLKLESVTDKYDTFEVEIFKNDRGEKIKNLLDVNPPKYYYRYSARIVKNNIKGDCFGLSPLNDNEQIDWSDINDGDVAQLQHIYEFEEI